jgi:hypothetical protein
MSRSTRLLRGAGSTLVVLVTLLLAGLSPGAQPRETPGVSGVILPETAQGKPPSWTGKAFRQGVVAVANPYGAEAGRRFWRPAATPSTPPRPSSMP